MVVHLSGGAKKVTTRSERAGEPWIFGLRPDDLPGFLDERGFAELSDWSESDHQINYLKPLGRMGPVSEFSHVVLAEVKSS